MLRFNLDIDVIADKWDSEEEKEVFLENFATIVQKGLSAMTVGDWTVKNVTVTEIED